MSRHWTIALFRRTAKNTTHQEMVAEISLDSAMWKRQKLESSEGRKRFVKKIESKHKEIKIISIEAKCNPSGNREYSVNLRFKGSAFAYLTEALRHPSSSQHQRTIVERLTPADYQAVFFNKVERRIRQGHSPAIAKLMTIWEFRGITLSTVTTAIKERFMTVVTKKEKADIT